MREKSTISAKETVNESKNSGICELSRLWNGGQAFSSAARFVRCLMPDAYCLMPAVKSSGLLNRYAASKKQSAENALLFAQDFELKLRGSG